jgi:GT2 family glycosyltransferase
MRLPWMRGYIESVSRISADTLLLIGWCLNDSESIDVRVQQQHVSTAGQARWVRYSRPDVPDCPFPTGFLAFVHLKEPVTAGAAATIVLEASRARISRRGAPLTALPDDLRSVVRVRLAWLDAPTRARLQACGIETLAQSSDQFTLAQSLAVIHRALHESARDRHVAPGVRRSAGLDAVLRTSESSFYLRGWLGSSARLHQFVAYSPEGHSVDLLPAACRFSHAASRNGREGFCIHAQLASPSLLADGWTVALVESDGAVTTLTGPPVSSAPEVVQSSLLADITADPPSPRLLRNYVYEGLARLQAEFRAGATIDERLELGAPLSNPDVSIVICLYRQLDLMQHQIAQFAADEDLRNAEIIYVLDSPELRGAFREMAFDLHDLYRMRIRGVILDHHAGYAAANNAGVTVANGRLLLLCNSDVFPTRTGWLREMTRFYDATPHVGAVAPKLLFEDNTIQHAGVYFHHERLSGEWSNRHYYKGFARGLPEANTTREVPAVTGACMMLARELYHQHEGFRSCYVQGDYEDSDLCLRLRAAGRHNWYLAPVEMYHLEGQSYETDLRRSLSPYNAWLHSRLWGETLAATMREFGNEHVP